MKTTKLLLAIAAFGISLSSFGQVKIGTNPTTIEPTSNLEVEASTAGRKMKVDKTTGQVTVKDGTEAFGDVFTSDANGSGSWLPAISSFASVRSSAASQFIPPSTPTIIGFSTIVFDRGSDFSTVTNEYTAPESGIYYIKGYTVFGQVPGLNQVWLLLYQNGGQLESLYLNGQVPGNTATYALGTTILYLNAGDKLQLRVQSNEGIFISGSTVQVAKLSN